MARSLITNRVNGQKKTYAVPTDAVNAQSFAETFLEGEYAIWKSEAKSGSDVVAVAPTLINVMMKDSTTDQKTYASFVIPANKSEDDLFAVLLGKTLNGVNVDYVVTLTQRICEKF
jgi:hypothetical protein